MPSERTLVTELSTALGMVGCATLDDAVRNMPDALADVSTAAWTQLQDLYSDGSHRVEFENGFANGEAFLRAPDALRGRKPLLVEWTGGRRPPGDEVVPSDLRIDHVYLISCKYLSRILHNPSPARLVEGLLTHGLVDDRSDWYHRTAPLEYQRLYEACIEHVGLADLPARASDLVKSDRRVLASALTGHWPGDTAAAYAELCRAVSNATAQRWSERIGRDNAEPMLWRLLRIGSAPYFVLGVDRKGSMQLRVDTPWDWRQAYQLRKFEVTAQEGGQPRVRWMATYETRHTGAVGLVHGHVELRWSHGRFGQPPEAKVYLDTRHEDVPGYHQL